jgi:hypothetical protein
MIFSIRFRGNFSISTSEHFLCYEVGTVSILGVWAHHCHNLNNSRAKWHLGKCIPAVAPGFSAKLVTASGRGLSLITLQLCMLSILFVIAQDSRRRYLADNCRKAALHGIGNMPLLDPSGMILRPDAEFVTKNTSIGIPMLRFCSLEPVVLGFEQSPKQSPP